jgi:hypothetical protein
MSAQECADADASDGVLGRGDVERSLVKPDALRARGKVSLPDAFFADMGLKFEYGSSTSGRDVEALNSLFASVGFSRRPEDKLIKAIEHSHDCVWVVATRS